jgi:hypothetical protein
MKLAYTMGHKNNYDQSLKEEPEVTKIGRTNDLNGEYYPGGCCWETYKEAKTYIEKHSPNIPYEPDIYGILLPNNWEQDTSNDTYEAEGFCSLLVDSKVVFVDKDGKQC